MQSKWLNWHPPCINLMENKKRIITIAVTLIVLIALLVITVVNMTSVPTSPNIVYLTQPVHAFTGAVTKVSKDTITLTREAYVTTDTTTVATPAPKKKITYHVKLTPQTKLNRVVLPIDYAQKTGTPQQSQQPTVTDIHQGDILTVQTNIDLRTLTADTFTATFINLPSVQKLLSGTVISSAPNLIRIKSQESFPVTDGVTDFSGKAGKQITYDIQLSDTTRIIKHAYDGMKETESKVNDARSLRPGVILTAYLQKDIKSKPYIMVLGEFSEFINTSVQNSTPSAVLPSPTP